MERRLLKPLPAEFFTRFGLYAQRDFLSPEVCSSLREEMRVASGGSATVIDGGDDAVDETHRRTKQAAVSEATKTLVRDTMLAGLPALGKHFERELVGAQPPQFLVYREGDFFRAHRDNSQKPDAPDYVSQRAVSAVVFINGEAPGDPDGYSGGSLTFFGLMDDDASEESVGLPLAGETGLLIAFSPQLIHSVSPVTAGERYTVVTWFFDD
jgi:predicted 2-oxoglutarate/Fe(II)-dependent dioxygenase YbiX